MLIPQFSIRWLLAVTAVCAGIFSIFGLALRGSSWAAGVSIGIVSAVVLLLVYALTFAVVGLFSLLSFGSRRQTAGRAGTYQGDSPFSLPGVAPASDKDVPAAPILLE